jgi:anti-sigma B factor antagonist
MQINKQLDGRVTRLGLAGELTIYCAAELSAALLASLVECDEVELELSAVTELDSAGFQQLYLWSREAHAANKRFFIRAHSPATREVFDLYRADAFFEVPA